MKKVILWIAILTALTACSPGQQQAGRNNPSEYAYVGCHVVHTPVVGNVYAFSPFGDLKVGDRLYFKQFSGSSTIKPLITSSPC
jgi:hypothetical protein|tara:strand:+ start:253 stop:504 length:252 start_codon:yes stop_codon:yes gene_type:complete